MKKKPMTLCFVRRENEVLLGLKKRGFGMGRWNGFGGKLQEGESIEDATKREVFEEVGIEIKALQKVGVIDFSWNHKPDILEVHIFEAKDFSGEAQESEEMKPEWFSLEKIPYEKMWSDDKYWLPLFLTGKKFEGQFLFDEKDQVLKQELKIIDNA